MVELVICKNEAHRIKNEGARVCTTININFSDAQGQIIPEWVVVSGQNLNSSKLSCMYSLPARMKMIQSNMEELEWSQHFPIMSLLGFFPANSAVLSPIWPNFKVVRDFTVVLVTCKNEEHPIKNEGARVFTTININFQTLKGS